MKVHCIRDLSNNYALGILEQGLEQSSEENYSPKLRNNPANLFFVLSSGRYKTGAYFIVEKDGEYVCSAGWNEYTEDTALVLTRAFVSKPYRGQFHMGSLLLPRMIEETAGYKHTWITCNTKNDSIYKWFVRSYEGKQPAMFNNWPDIYKSFTPIGEKTIYYTQQLVVELQR